YFTLPHSTTNSDPHSFPTRRSSDLRQDGAPAPQGSVGEGEDRAVERARDDDQPAVRHGGRGRTGAPRHEAVAVEARADDHAARKSEEHTSELQSRENLVCRLLLEKK